VGVPLAAAQGGNTVIRRRLCLILTMVLAGTSLSLVQSSTPFVDRAEAQAATVANSDEAYFANVCRYVKTAPDDPIVAPGVPGGSHSHQFFGNKLVNAYSTPGSLRDYSATTFDAAGNASSYWIPTVFANGAEHKPNELKSWKWEMQNGNWVRVGSRQAIGKFYYRVAVVHRNEVQTIPAGLRMIAGDAGASAPQGGNMQWHCGIDNRYPAKINSVNETCPVEPSREAGKPGIQTYLSMWVIFPDCWNGRDLDSPDHKSHMAYSNRGPCPSTHPVRIPRLLLAIPYDGNAASTYTKPSAD